MSKQSIVQKSSELRALFDADPISEKAIRSLHQDIFQDVGEDDLNLENYDIDIFEALGPRLRGLAFAALLASIEEEM